MAYAVARYLTADIEFVARQESIKVLIYGFLFLAVLHNLHRLETIQFLGLTLVFLAAGIAMYGIIQYLTSSDRVWHFVRPVIYHKRGSGTFINPNHFAGYLEMLLPLALTYTLSGRFNYVMKILLGYASLVIFGGIVVSVSRGAWIATGITLVVLFGWLLKTHGYRVQAVTVLLVLSVIATGFVLRAELSPNRRDSLASLMDTENLRFRLWQPAIALWKENPWWGAGPAHFDYRFRQYRPGGTYSWSMQVRPERVHNDYLNTLVDWGLVGALLVALAWALFYWDVIRGWKYVQRAQTDLAAKRGNKSSFVMGAALGLLAILLHSVTDFNMHMPANALLAVTLMAMVSGHFRYTTERYWHTVHVPLRLGITVLLAGGAAYLGWQSWVRSRECYWLARAEKFPENSLEQMNALTKAFGVEPKNFETAYRLGEGYRLHSWRGEENYKRLAQTAMDWFQRTIELNAFDPYSRIRYGMCLHWIGRHELAEPYFKRALELDPNGHYTVAHMGWHFVQLEQWGAAKKCFERSIQLLWNPNPVASNYLEIVNRKLAEAAAASPQSAANP